MNGYKLTFDEFKIAPYPSPLYRDYDEEAQNRNAKSRQQSNFRPAHCWLPWRNRAGRPWHFPSSRVECVIQQERAGEKQNQAKSDLDFATLDEMASRFDAVLDAIHLGKHLGHEAIDDESRENAKRNREPCFESCHFAAATFGTLRVQPAPIPAPVPSICPFFGPD